MMIEPAKRGESDTPITAPTAREPRVRTAGESPRRGSSSSRSSKSSRDARSSRETKAAPRRQSSGGGGTSRRRPASVSNRPGALQSRGSARIIAPIALAIFAIACFAVVTNKDDTKAGKSGSAKSSSQAKGTKAATNANGGVAITTRKTYTVKSGDSFNAIAEKFNIQFSKLKELNSDVDPLTLQPGQKLKLK
jgi:LysM repeat protein